MKTLTRTLSVGALIALVPALQAADGGKWYVKADGGVAFQQDVGVKSIGGIGLPAVSPALPHDVPIRPAHLAADIGAALDDLDIHVPAGALDEIGGLLSSFGFDLSTVDPFTIPAGTTLTIGKPKVSWNTGFRFDLAAGYNINDNLAVELESGLVYNTADKLKIGASLNIPAGTGDPDFPYVPAADIPIPIDLKLKGVGVDLTMYQVPILANLIYKIPLEGKLKPYIGGGVGGVWTIVDYNLAGLVSGSKNDFTFAYQLMAGAAYEISEKAQVDVSYKFLGSLEHEFGGLVKTDPTHSHAIMASFSYKF